MTSAPASASKHSIECDTAMLSDSPTKPPFGSLATVSSEPSFLAVPTSVSLSSPPVPPAPALPGPPQPQRPTRSATAPASRYDYDENSVIARCQAAGMTFEETLAMLRHKRILARVHSLRPIVTAFARPGEPGVVTAVELLVEND